MPVPDRLLAYHRRVDRLPATSMSLLRVTVFIIFDPKFRVSQGMRQGVKEVQIGLGQDMAEKCLSCYHLIVFAR